jgi:hypothetical protein
VVPRTIRPRHSPGCFQPWGQTPFGAAKNATIGAGVSRPPAALESAGEALAGRASGLAGPAIDGLWPQLGKASKSGASQSPWFTPGEGALLLMVDLLASALSMAEQRTSLDGLAPLAASKGPSDFQ